MSKNKNTDKIIKEFLFHSLSNEQLVGFRKFFSIHSNNVMLFENSSQMDVMSAEIKIFGGVLSSDFPDLDSMNLKIDDKFFLFPNRSEDNRIVLMSSLND
ncbi:hypothetical protein MHL31_04235 [Lutibacter sp. A80]|uniref:hypothetical protein n=1 Tax=Lutibacter sp. A80 TaxID=2918453 RepID=UPI001F068521|nr:hypothetical protein [Lutibacter sp. A80]UMB61417.1 hypothetical protein MHL31_04235 [Lutibacter sp. A80]